MTDRLASVFERISTLSESSQNEFADWIESELVSDQRGSELYARSQDKLAGMAMEAKAEYKAGETENLDPDSL